MITVKFNAEEMRNAIKYAERAIPSTPGLLAFSALNFSVSKDHILITGSDGDITNTARITAVSDGNATFLLPPKPFAGFLSTIASSERITLKINQDDEIEVCREGSNKYILRPLSATYPPAISSNSSEVQFQLPDIESAIKVVKPSTGKDGQSILLISNQDGVSFYSTDGYRLSSISFPGISFGDHKIHLPLKVIENAAKLSISNVVVDEKNSIIRFSSKDASVTARQIATPYQNVEAIINRFPELDGEFFLSKDDLLPALTRLSSICEGEPLVCELESDKLKLSVSNITLGAGVEIINILESTVGQIRFGVSLQYLKEAVNSHFENKITVKINSPEEPIFLKTSNVMTIVMPVKINP